MATAARASSPKMRKGRTATVRPSTNYINSNSTADIASALRLQRLFGIGVAGNRANLIASLAWGAAGS